MSAVREDDVPARYGGEEFVVLLRNPGPEVAFDVGERVRSAVAALDLGRFGVGKVSVSVGVAVSSRADQPIEDLDRPGRPGALSGQEARAATGSSPPEARPGRATDYHRPVTTDQAALTNGDLARIFHEIGDMLELKGELGFKVIAYHRAADAIGRSPVDLVSAYRSGDPPRIPGVGKAISDKLAELATTGRLAFHERLRAEVPPRLVELLQVSGLGPKSVRQLHQELGHRVARRPARGRRGRPPANRPRHVGPDRGARPRGAGRLADRPPERMRLDRAEELVTAVIAALAALPGVRSLEPAGSFRRRRETIGDLDVLAETDDPAALMAAFTSLPMAETVVNRGLAKSAIRLVRGPQVDLMAMPPQAAGTYRIHFTGSKEHNVRLRAMARDQGWSLSEKGFLRIGEDGEPLTGADAELRTFRDRGRRRTPSSACRSSSRSCARTRVRSRRRWPGTLPRLVYAVGPARRPAQPLGLVGRPPADRGR